MAEDKKAMNINKLPSLNVNTGKQAMAGKPSILQTLRSYRGDNPFLRMYSHLATNRPEAFKGKITNNATGKVVYKKGGKVKAKKPRDGRIKKAKCRDGIAQRGKTRGRMR
jgi:hypothetical protein